MAQEATTHDAQDIDIVVGTILIDSGYADGEFLRIARDTEDYVDVVGTDGRVTRSKTNDRRARATIILGQTSKSNDALSALRLAGLSIPNGGGIFPFVVRDKHGTTLYAADQAWIEGEPEAGFGREAGSREWKIRIAALNSFIGGK